MANAELQIEVVYSPSAGLVWRWEGEVPVGSVLVDALRLSGLLDVHPELTPPGCIVGIWGHRCGYAQGLRDKDRIEVYRPLRVDPKESRRMRYDKQREGTP